MAAFRGVTEVFQRVRAWFFDSPELDLDPASVKEQYISNIWRRTITYIWGVKDGVSIPVKVTEGGALEVKVQTAIELDVPFTFDGDGYLETVIPGSVALTVPLSFTDDGYLKVAECGSGLTAYDVKTGGGPDDHCATGQLEPVGGGKRWDFLIETQDATIKFLKPDESTYYAEIPLVVGYYSIPIDSPGVSLINRVSGVSCAFHISAFH